MVEITEKGYRRSKFDNPITKKCEWCGYEFQIVWKSQKNKRFCSASCSAKWRMSQPEIKAKVHTKEVHERIGKKKSEWLHNTEKGMQEIERIRKLNPTSNSETREKLSKTLKKIHHKPIIQGGNGKGMTIPQGMIYDCLKGDWTPKLAISLGKKQPNYPTCYKVDIGNEKLKIGIEVDGYSHHSRKNLDKKKDAKLSELGWIIIRFWNDDILDWKEKGMPDNHFITKTLIEHGIEIERK